MSRGISIYYKVLKSNSDNIWYVYSGVDLNKTYKEEDILSYDGVIKFSKQTTYTGSVVDYLRDGNIVIEKECKHENHHSRLIDKETGLDYGYFALKVISKVVLGFVESGTYSFKNSIVF